MKKGTIINNVTAAVSAFVMGVAISDALWIKSRKEERRRREEDFYDDEGLFFDDDDDDEGERRYPELNVDSLRTIWGYEVDDLVDNEIMKPAGELLEESADLTPNELEAVRYLIRACVGYIVETGSFEERNFLMLRTFLSYAEAADCDDTVDLLFREEKNKNDNFAMREYVSWYEHYRALVILYGKEKVVSAALLIADDIVEKLYGYHARYSYSMAFCRHLSNAIRDAGISEEFEEAIENTDE